MISSQHVHPVDGTPNGPAPRWRRRWGLATMVGFACAAAAVAAVYVWLPPDFVASSVIYIDATPDVILNPDVREDEDFETYKRTQMFRALSRVVLDNALNEPVRNTELKRFGLKSIGDLSLIKEQAYPIDWLEMNLSVSERQEEFFVIEMEYSEKPEEMAEIVNAVTEVYIRDVAHEGILNDKKRITKLEHLADDYEQKSNKNREHVNKLRRRLGLNDGEPLTLIAAAEQELTRKLQEKWTNQYLELKTLQLQIASEASLSLDSDAIKANPKMEKLIRSFIEQELKVVIQETAADRMRADIRLLEKTLDDKDHPKLVQLRKDLAKQELRVAELKALVEPTFKATLRDYQAAMREQQRTSMMAKVETLQESIAATEKELKKRQQHAKSLSVETRELKQLQADAERFETKFDEIVGIIDDLKIELKIPDQIQLQQYAEVPRIKDWTSLRLKSAQAGGGAFLVAFALTLLIAPRKLV